LIILTLVPPDAPLELVIDDTLFRRRGPRVFAVRWCYDGAATGPTPVGFGNCFVVLGIVVSLPFSGRPVCLPLLSSLWEGGSKVVIARRLVLLVAERFPERVIHVAGDGAYVSRDLRGLPSRITWTTRLRKNAELHDLTPPRTGRPGRPRTKGEQLGSLAELATTLPWTTVTVTRYGVTGDVEVADLRCLWYHPFATQPVRVVLVRVPRKTGFETCSSPPAVF
jgi:hypothetical protein